MPGGEKNKCDILNDLYSVASDVFIEILLYLVNQYAPVYLANQS